MSMWGFNGTEIIFTKLRPLKLLASLAAFCTLGYRVCLINFSKSFQWMFLRLSRHNCGHIENMHVGF